MTLNIARMGTYDKQSQSDTINGAIDGMRTFGPLVSPPVAMWAIGIGFWGGRDGAATPVLEPALYEGSLVAPYARIGIANAISTGTSMSDASGGTRYERTWSSIDDVALFPRSATRKVPLTPGTHYRLALNAHGAMFRYSALYDGVFFSAVYNGQVESRGSVTSPPASFSPANTEGQQIVTIYAYGYENVAPLPPIGREPFDTIESLTPDFRGLFRDLNGAYGASSGEGVDTGDYLTGIRIQCRHVATQATVWATTLTATTAEAEANEFVRTYGGSALTRGETYEWRVQVKDALSAWSDWSSWLSFTVAARGFVTLDGAPTGTVDAITGLTFDGKWTSAQAESTDRVQIRLLNSSGSTVVQQGAEIVKTVAHSAAPGTAFTITWAESGFSDLNWNTAYAYSVRGRDTSGQWSNWSTPRTFRTDAAPTIPANLAPTGDKIFTNYPILSAAFSDTDDDSTGTLTGVYRLTRPDASTVDVTPTYNTATGKWEFQTTATELPAFGTYTWQAVGFDGTLYSGESTTLAGASWSNSSGFQYLAGPTVTITSPATDPAAVAASSLTVTWTATEQISKRVRLYRVDTGAVAYDSTTIASAVQSHEIPSGSYRNNTSYVLEVTVTDSVPLPGTDSITINVAYTPAAESANVAVSTTTFGLEPVNSGVLVTWDQTTYPTVGDPRFVETLIYRTTDGGPDDGTVLLASIDDPTTTAFIDFHPASGYAATYTVAQTIMAGVDTLTSEPVGDTVSLALGQNHILTLLSNPATYRGVLTNVQTKGFSDVTDQVVYPSLGGGLPVTVFGPSYYATGTLTAAIIATERATADALLAALKDLRAQLGTICYRDGAGTKFFAQIVDFSYEAQIGDAGGRWYTVAMSLRQEAVTEGTVA